MAKEKKVVGAPLTEAVEGAEVEAKEAPKRGDPFEGIRIEDMKPYTTAEELPDDEVKYRMGKTNAGQNVEGRTILCGAPRFYLEHTRTNPAGLRVYNLIGKYRNGKGIGSRNLRVLKVMKKNKMSTSMSRLLVQDRLRDQQWFDTLTKKNGIPVYGIGEAP